MWPAVRLCVHKKIHAQTKQNEGSIRIVHHFYHPANSSCVMASALFAYLMILPEFALRFNNALCLSTRSVEARNKKIENRKWEVRKKNVPRLMA